MSRILVLMDHKENRRLLADWLATRYTVLAHDKDGAVDEEYDLCILDGTALDRLADRIQDRKKYQMTVFLPFLLVTAEQHVDLMTRHLWKSIDEVIHSPLDKFELQARIEVLLRARRQAVALRQAGERALRQSEERLGLMIEGVQDYALFLMDPSGHVSGWNAGAERLLGYESEEIIGQPLSQFFTPEDRQTGKPERELETARTVGRASDDNWLVRKDGSRFWASGLITALQNGSLRGYVKVCRNLSERKQAEEVLRKTEQRLQFVMDSMPQKIFTAKPNGDVDYFNPQWSDFTGLSFEQIRDWGWTQFIHPDDVAENLRVWQHSINTGEPFQFEHRFRRADGEYRWHLSRAKAFKDAEGKVLMWVGSNTDIHDQVQTAEDLRKLTAELSEADRRKDEFLATLAHELRNPLAPIRNAVQIIRLSSDRAAREQARIMMERQLTQMVRLVDDLLDVSRISRGRIELRKEQVELSAVVQSAVETSRPLIEAAGHELTVTLPPETIQLDADLPRLAQVFSNLLNNAAKYTEPSGHIWLIAERDGGEFVVRVRDTGLGIPADMLPKIFEMFTQIGRSLERSQGGLGIGLTLVKQLVEMHGGSVEARSDGPGKGSEFTVRLPVTVPSAQPQPPTVEDEKSAAPAKRRILVADDNKDSADSLSMMLKVMGMEVRTAYDGLEAVEAAAAFNPDVVLLDIGMPKLNGYETARRIREQSWGKDMVLVAVTGWGQEEDRRRSQEVGFNAHMVKPVDAVDLQQMLAALK